MSGRITAKKLFSLTDGKETKYIAPLVAELFYDVIDGEVLIRADDCEPILIQKENSLLLNATVCQVGVDSVGHTVSGTANNISILLENIRSKKLRAMSISQFRTDRHCGITPLLMNQVRTFFCSLITPKIWIKQPMKLPAL